MNFDFSNLAPKQQELLSFGGWDLRDTLFPQPNPSTVRKLIARGLLLQKGGAVPQYVVPPAVHAAWCAHCALKG